MTLTSTSLQTTLSLQTLISFYPMPALAFQATAEHPVVALNRGAEELTGLNWGETSKISLLQFISPDDRAVMEAGLRKLAFMPSQALEGIRLQNKAGLFLYVRPTLVMPTPSLTIANATYGFCFFEEAQQTRRSYEALQKRFGHLTKPGARESNRTSSAAGQILEYRSVIDLNRDLRDPDSELYKGILQGDKETPLGIHMTGDQAAKVFANGYLDTFIQMLNRFCFSHKLAVPTGKRVIASRDGESGRSEVVLELVYRENTFKRFEKPKA